MTEDATTTPSTTNSLSAAGTVAFTDVDLVDNHTATFAADPTNTTCLGTFTLDQCRRRPTRPTARWAGATASPIPRRSTSPLARPSTENYVVTVDDGHGGTAAQTVTVTITGTNDDPTITSSAQAGTVTEDATTTPSTTDALSAAGTVAFTDVDLIDGHTATFAADPTNTTSLGTFALDAAVTEAANAADGTVGWSYALTNSAAQYLAAGQTATEKYVVTVDDGHGGTAQQTVTVTITGTNDDPTITSGAQAGTVTEDADTTASATDSLTAAGTVAFTDVDLIDSHTATFAADPSNTTSLGTFALDAAVTEAANAADGTVGWSYVLDQRRGAVPGRRPDRDRELRGHRRRRPRRHSRPDRDGDHHRNQRRPDDHQRRQAGTVTEDADTTAATTDR